MQINDLERSLLPERSHFLCFIIIFILLFTSHSATEAVGLGQIYRLKLIIFVVCYEYILVVWQILEKDQAWIQGEVSSSLKIPGKIDCLW